MKHITEVLVYSNRCEVVNGHIFTVGDKGLPHIRLKFQYMFEIEDLRGKTLECKYILPSGKYTISNVSIENIDNTTFPIGYAVFTESGWSTLKITLIDGRNRVTLDDITIKTKSVKLGEALPNREIEKLIQAEVVAKTENVKQEGEKQKAEIQRVTQNALLEIESKKESLRGESGVGIKEIENDGTNVKITLTDDSVKNINYPGTTALKVNSIFKNIEIGEFILKDLQVVSGTGNSRVVRVPLKETFGSPPFISLMHDENAGRLTYIFNITTTSFDISTNYFSENRRYKFMAFELNSSSDILLSPTVGKDGVGVRNITGDGNGNFIFSLTNGEEKRVTPYIQKPKNIFLVFDGYMNSGTLRLGEDDDWKFLFICLFDRNQNISEVCIFPKGEVYIGNSSKFYITTSLNPNARIELYGEYEVIGMIAPLVWRMNLQNLGNLQVRQVYKVY